MFILSSIHFSNNNVWVALNLLSQLNKDRLEFLAVSAPRSISLKKDILISSKNHSLEVVSDDDFNRLIIGLWNGSRFIVDLKFVFLEVLKRLN
jgi:hypothetical protein